MIKLTSSNKIIAVAVVFLLVAIRLGWLDPVGDFIVWASKPLTAPLRGISLGISNTASSLFSVKDLQRENASLKERVVLLETENTTLRSSLTDQAEFEKALNFKARTGYNVAAARIVSSDPTSLNQKLLVDRGESAGIINGQAVVDAAGAYIGRISKTGHNTSEIVLISDTSSRLPVEVVESGARGVLLGEHALSVSMAEVPQGQEIPIGGRVVTTGFTPGIPTGLFIGYVDSLRSKAGDLFQEVNVRPAADLHRLKTVFIIVGTK